MVRIRPILAPLRSPVCSAWCAQVTVVPESSRVRVLTSGRCEGRHGLDALAAARCAQAVARLPRSARAVRHVMEQRHLEEDPEPGDEEHHLRGDEQDHAVAQADGDHRGVVALVGFLHHVASTSRSWCRARRARPAKNSQQVPLGRPNRPFIQITPPSAMTDGRDRADQRPRARIDQVVVVLDAVVGHVGP